MKILTLLLAALALRAETVTEFSSETRFQIDFKVPDAALAAFLPQGFTSFPATEGPAKDCNLRVIFIDRLSINDPKTNAPMGKGSNRFVLLAAPVKNAAGELVQMVIGGLTEDPADAPGQFGNYLQAKTHLMQRATNNAGGSIVESQDWVMASATGEKLEMHITYERNAAPRRPMADVKYYSAKNPGFYHISRQEMVLDILKNVTTAPPDHVKKWSYKAGGGSYSKLFDGTEKVLSWDNIESLNRSIVLP